MCNKSKNIGGYPENYTINEKGEPININEIEFHNFQNKLLRENVHKDSKKNIKELILNIEHENSDVDLYNKRIVIFEGNEHELLYNSKYQDKIKINIGFNYLYYSNFRIYVLDEGNNTVHKFTSELTYPIFDNNVRELDIKLYENDRFAYKNEILYRYKITNLKSEFEQLENGHK